MAGAGTQANKVSMPKPSDSLLRGVKLKRWDDEMTPHVCEVRADELGLVLGVVAEGKETTCLDTALISDVRVGTSAKAPKDAKTREALLEGSCPLDNRLVTVVYGSSMFEMQFANFAAFSLETANEFAADVNFITRNVFRNNDNVNNFLRKGYAKLCFLANSDGLLPIKHVTQLLAPSTKEEKKQFEEALRGVALPSGKDDMINLSNFSFDVFYHLYCSYVKRTDLEALLLDLSGGKKPFLSLPQLRDLLNKTQRDPRLNEILHPFYSDDQVDALIKEFEANVSMTEKGNMSLLALQKLLQSNENRLIDLMQLDMSHDMTQPLSHYFMNSSHNTYLTGHQLTGKSSVEIYRQALLSGCRCVELDCWDGEQEPVITHGYTMVTAIVFKDVINAINETAFVTSDYPVILSFENHCSVKQQQKMAQYCREIFKDKLLVMPLDDIPLQEGVALPSPERLKGKILIKNKKKAAAKEAIEETKFEEGAGKIRPINEDGSSGVTSDGTAPAHTNGTPSNEEIAQKQSQAYSWEVQSETNLELAALVNYITPVRFKSFEDAHKKNRSYEMSSLSETTAAAHLKQNPVEFVNYNKRQLTRVYPKGSRYDSSNYMPQVFWNTGCQIVALNFQTYDVPFQLHLGKFEFNKSCGYLLKPVCMRRPDKEFDPFVESPMDGVVAATLKVKIISGQMLCGHRCGTYVELEMYGLPTDTVRRRYKTRTVQSTQMNTVWNEEQWVFKKVVVPELVMLRFAVYDDGNRFLSQRVIPLTAIQAGYRHIPLRNELNQPIDYATLFVLFEVSDYIPDGMADFLAALSNPIAYQSAVQKRAKQLEELYDDDEEQEGGGEQLPTASTSSIPNETDPKSSKVLSTSFSSNLTTSDAGSPESYDIRNAYTLTRDSSDASNKIQSLNLDEAEATTSKESQLEHRKSSKDMLDEVQKFKDKQKDKVSDKEEMDRILREYRNKLAKQTAERRNNLTEQQQSERKRFLEDYERRLQQFKEDEAKSLASFQRDANASTSDD